MTTPTYIVFVCAEHGQQFLAEGALLRCEKIIGRHEENRAEWSMPVLVADRCEKSLERVECIPALTATDETGGSANG